MVSGNLDARFDSGRCGSCGSTQYSRWSNGLITGGTETTRIYCITIRSRLQDCCYVGRQKCFKQGWPCEAFLVDGKPDIDKELFARIQDRLKAGKRGSPAHYNAHPLAGLVRCGAAANLYVAGKKRFETRTLALLAGIQIKEKTLGVPIVCHIYHVQSWTGTWNFYLRPACSLNFMIETLIRRVEPCTAFSSGDTAGD
jgi:hypothetical protein